MKLARICMAFVATLMFASICAAQCGPAKGKPAGGSVEAAIIAHEMKIIEAIKKKDASTFKNLVDVNGNVVGPDGMHKVSAIVDMLFSPDLTFSQYTMEDPQSAVINKDVAILSYKSVTITAYQGKTMSETAYETSVYSKRGDKWIVVFHQTSSGPQSSAGGAATTMK